MNFVLKSISYVFHPLLMPLLGVLFYFHKTPRFIPEPLQHAKLFSISLLTIILPLLVYYLLKTIKKVNSINLQTTEERKLPLLINAIIISLVISRVFPADEIIELYFFFIGILCSTLICLILTMFKIKASIHMLAAGGFFMFVVCLGYHFKINVNGTIAILLILLGALGTSRLHLKAHTLFELAIGLITGIIPQLFVLKWYL